MGRKVILYIGHSLDGFIADKSGGVSWLVGQGTESEPDNSYLEFIAGIDTVIIGMRTYEQIISELSPHEWPYPNMKSYVFTSNKQVKTRYKEEVEFFNGDLIEFIQQLKDKKEGKNIWICGGANIVNQLVKADLIDEYQLTSIPVILGQGIPLFTQDNPCIELKLDKISEFDGMVTSVYSRR